MGFPNFILTKTFKFIYSYIYIYCIMNLVIKMKKLKLILVFTMLIVIGGCGKETSSTPKYKGATIDGCT